MAELSREGIKDTILRPGKRFQAALVRVNFLIKHLERFLELAKSNADSLPNSISPTWSPMHSCTSCHKHIPIGKHPWAFQAANRNATTPSADVVAAWRHEYNKQVMPMLLKQILCTMHLPPRC